MSNESDLPEGVVDLLTHTSKFTIRRTPWKNDEELMGCSCGGFHFIRKAP